MRYRSFVMNTRLHLAFLYGCKSPELFWQSYRHPGTTHPCISPHPTFLWSLICYIKIPEHTLGQCTLPNKFFTHPTLLALMCNLGARGVLPRGNTATVCLVRAYVCLCVCVRASECVRWPVSGPGPSWVPIRRPRTAHSFAIQCWWKILAFLSSSSRCFSIFITFLCSVHKLNCAPYELMSFFHH